MMDDDLDRLREPIQTLASEARHHLEGKPTPEQLLDYHRGVLPAERKEALQSYLALSPDATAALLDMRSFPEIECRQAGFELSDEDIAAEWEAVQQRLESPATEAAAASVTPLNLPAKTFSFPLPLVFAAAAGFLLAIVGLSPWILGLRQTVAGLSTPRVDVFLADLVPQAPRRAEEGPRNTIRVPPWTDRILLILNLAEPPSFPDYLVEISDTAVLEIFSASGLKTSPGGNFTLELPRHFLPADRYRIRLHGLSGESRSPVAEYTVEIEYL